MLMIILSVVALRVAMLVPAVLLHGYALWLPWITWLLRDALWLLLLHALWLHALWSITAVWRRWAKHFPICFGLHCKLFIQMRKRRRWHKASKVVCRHMVVLPAMLRVAMSWCLLLRRSPAVV